MVVEIKIDYDRCTSCKKCIEVWYAQLRMSLNISEKRDIVKIIREAEQ